MGASAQAGNTPFPDTYPALMALTADPINTASLLCICLYFMCIFVYCDGVRVMSILDTDSTFCASKLHTLTSFLSRLRLPHRERLTVWCLALMPSCHSQIKARVRLCVCTIPQSMLVLTWHSLHSPGVVLFLDTDWRCVSSSGSVKLCLSWSHNTHYMCVWMTCSTNPLCLF